MPQPTNVYLPAYRHVSQLTRFKAPKTLESLTLITHMAALLISFVC